MLNRLFKCEKYNEKTVSVEQQNFEHFPVSIYKKTKLHSRNSPGHERNIPTFRIIKRHAAGVYGVEAGEAEPHLRQLHGQDVRGARLLQ